MELETRAHAHDTRIVEIQEPQESERARESVCEGREEFIVAYIVPVIVYSISFYIYIHHTHHC